MLDKDLIRVVESHFLGFAERRQIKKEDREKIKQAFMAGALVVAECCHYEHHLLLKYLASNIENTS